MKEVLGAVTEECGATVGAGVGAGVGARVGAGVGSKQPTSPSLMVLLLPKHAFA